MFEINGEIWYILFVAPESAELMRSDGKYTLGACDDEVKTIYINNTLDNIFLQKVLCHEITHAAMFSYNIDLTIEQEELLADLLATYGQEIIANTNCLFHRIKEKRGT